MWECEVLAFKARLTPSTAGVRMNGSFSGTGFLFVCMFVVDFIECDEM